MPSILIVKDGKLPKLNRVPHEKIDLKSPSSPPPPQPGLTGSDGRPPSPERRTAEPGGPQKIPQLTRTGYIVPLIVATVSEVHAGFDVVEAENPGGVVMIVVVILSAEIRVVVTLPFEAVTSNTALGITLN